MWENILLNWELMFYQFKLRRKDTNALEHLQNTDIVTNPIAAKQQMLQTLNLKMKGIFALL